MRITERLKIALKAMLNVKMGEIATDIATLIWDGDEDLKEGLAVYIKDESAEDGVKVAEDGEYKTEDGKKITVKDGIVEAITDPEAEVAPENNAENNAEVSAEENEEVAPADAPENVPDAPNPDERIAALEAKVAEFIEGINQIVNTVAALEGRIEELEAKVAKVETEPAADPAETQTVEESETPKSRLSYLRKN